MKYILSRKITLSQQVLREEYFQGESKYGTR